MLTKEELQNRIIAINEELIQTRNNAVKLQGHLDEAHHWLATMHKAELEVPAESTEPAEPVEPCEPVEESQEAA